MPFTTFGLHPDLLRGIQELGFTRPTPIQSDAIPPAMAGKDVLAAAQTGSGKTAAFLLPILQRLLGKKRGTTRALILTPTRELAAQIDEHLRDLSVHTPISGAAVYGGVAMGPQEHAFRTGVDVLVATPGRLLDHFQYPYARLDSLEILVIDEADRMLDMGFLPDIRRVLRHVPDVGEEAHVEHAVGLVDNEDLQAVEPRVGVLEVIEEPAGRGHEDVDAGPEGMLLRPHGHAAVDRGAGDRRVHGEIAQMLVDLRRELTRRREDQRPGRPALLAEQSLEDRQEEGRGLAAASHRRREDILAGHGRRDGVALDRRRPREAELLDAAEEIGVKSKGGKWHKGADRLTEWPAETTRDRSTEG